MAPEVADGGVETMGSDVWSYAVLVYRMLVGTFPFPPLHQDERVHDPWWVNAIWRVSSILDRSPEACSFFAAVFKVKKEDRPSARELQGHEFFQDIDWENLAQGTSRGPLLDQVETHRVVPASLEELRYRPRMVQGPIVELTAGPEPC
ncbi:hypothetical protein BSKO_13526 [Bryopsis sp. KO-2023]|nr:hypothetical protein BSKO_13526 [Bryopsis sp. KO-2023]